tara:strand:+ start:229 stop:447 length:219 start_codon:yes stop_codon:yes gene_type:complete
MKVIDEIVSKYLGIRLTDCDDFEFVRYRFSNSTTSRYAAKEIRKKCVRHVSISDNVIFVWNEYHTLDMEEID